MDELLPACLTFYSTGCNAFDKLLLGYEEYHQYWHQHEDGCGHQMFRSYGIFSLPEHSQSHREGPHILGIGNDQGPQITVPFGNEQVERQGANHRAGQGQRNMKQGPHMTQPIYFRRVIERIWYGKEILTQQESAEYTGHMGYDNTRVLVDPARCLRTT